VVEEKDFIAIVFICKNVRNKHFVPKNQNERRRMKIEARETKIKKVQGHRVKTTILTCRIN
jgi:hypothetical protein